MLLLWLITCEDMGKISKGKHVIYEWVKFIMDVAVYCVLDSLMLYKSSTIYGLR